MDSYAVGYFIGRYATRVMIYITKAQLAVMGYRKVSNVAKVHKIDHTNADEVAENLFECLEFIDW